jgi:dipeptidyl-peptidase-4
MYRDFTVRLEDQVDVLRAMAQRFGFLDLGRVGMRGWSFGGELTATALAHRQDVFHAGVVGAPVTDQRLYTPSIRSGTWVLYEAVPGSSQDEPEVYRRNSPLFDAASLSRPMLLIHGPADDNVYVANSLRLSAALFEAGKSHELMLIPNATHLTRSTAVTENIPRIQLVLLRRTVAGSAG